MSTCSYDRTIEQLADEYLKEGVLCLLNPLLATNDLKVHRIIWKEDERAHLLH